MSKQYLNSRNTPIIATYFSHAFSSQDVAKFVMEEWFLSESLNSKNAANRFEQHFMVTTNLCRPSEYQYGNKLIGYTLNASLVEFFDHYVCPNYESIKTYIYEEMETILKMYACETPEQLLNDILTEMKPYTYDMNNVMDHLFDNYILKSDYREKNDRFFEKFSLNWLNEQNFKFILR
jgi:hypothetical protein